MSVVFTYFGLFSKGRKQNEVVDLDKGALEVDKGQETMIRIHCTKIYF